MVPQRKVLEYQRPVPSPWRRWVIRGILIPAAVLLLALSLPTFWVRQETGWVDAISGSRKYQTDWRLGWSTTPGITDSALALRYRKLGLQWNPDWRCVQGTYVNLFGRHIGWAHGTAPPILAFGVVDQLYAGSASDEEVRGFFRVMTAGTDAEQKAEVEEAADRVFANP